ncbi:hypothetical protein VdG2_05305 [Verticillium dahliae VDG2]|nr:hypothetical protein VdG2_05305 [Verticillium dahliae VDG2]
MVHQKAQATLHIVYKGRLSDGREAGGMDGMSVSGYSDTFALDPMNAGKPGKQMNTNVPGFEFVSDSHMDFEFYKNRPEFADEHGQGDLFGADADRMRPGTPGSHGGDVDSFRMAPTPGPSTGALGGGPRGYSNLPQAEAEQSPGDADPSQYDYFRGNARSQRRPGEGW